jgi:hypothetical protein
MKSTWSCSGAGVVLELAATRRFEAEVTGFSWNDRRLACLAYVIRHMITRWNGIGHSSGHGAERLLHLWRGGLHEQRQPQMEDGAHAPNPSALVNPPFTILREQSRVYVLDWGQDWGHERGCIVTPLGTRFTPLGTRFTPLGTHKQRQPFVGLVFYFVYCHASHRKSPVSK